ncbi:MAG: hypothetical protein A3F12_07530 [Gammaproteobacteria bacterium RIFCSPHIGHO2_12_FULL_38_14]|nr:MAG: hypothetical protein A3F12_07530 [Gammaproteobacteria bacterium RIFCSPHIGHO2_12_FULL_38_14]
MQLYKGTGCWVTLVGSLMEMPIISSTAIICIEIKKLKTDYLACLLREETENYQVVINMADANKIIKFGYPGMHLSIIGKLKLQQCLKNNIRIIAEKIDFVYASPKTEFDAMPNTMLILH